ncbi:hypothetical protein ACSW8Q_13240 [Clostridium perfringens]|uniref:hypothetical protein n=1 Tax=Clostridium perfringens TaxID=1502 RepID=UPI0024BD5787|nr:hypothetical protein [Clostridium perfringens]
MGERALKRRYEKFKKASSKATQLEYQFIKEFKKTVPYDKLLSLKKAVAEKGTEDDKEKYFKCCENYKKGIITKLEYEIYTYCNDVYGVYTEECKFKECILEMRD